MRYNVFKMKNLMLVALLLVQIAVVGCSGGSSDPINDKDYLKKSEEQGKEKRQIFLRSEGEFDKMNTEDRKKFLSFFENESEARGFWEIMKNPPGVTPNRQGTN
jgi:hypothetical protein